MVGSNVKRASRSMIPAGTTGGKSGSSAGVGTKSTVWSGSGVGVDGASPSASSSRKQFSKSPNVSGRCVRVEMANRIIVYYRVDLRRQC